MATKTPVEYWTELQRIAASRGGELLSRTYVNDVTKLRFRCLEGHEWTQSPSQVKQGHWCRACGLARNAAPKKARAYAELRHVVARRRGVIVSTEYVNSQTKMRFRCGEGHEWDAVPMSIVRDIWCPACGHGHSRASAARKRSVERKLQRVARRRGGELLELALVNSRLRHRYRCERGHTWEATAAKILGGGWCSTCEADDLLQRLRANAEKRGGSCLSKVCRHVIERLSWRCALGHRWEATAQRFLEGTWCPTCLGQHAYSIQRLREVARERGGECLSGKYVVDSKVRWRCDQGHEWMATSHSVIQGRWCRICRNGQGVRRPRLTIEIMCETAAERGGECLSKTYNSLRDRLRWRCAMGHEWTTIANNVRRGSWCPRCSHSMRGTLERMRAFAVEMGGRCLTRTWNDHRQLLSFVCRRGHRFRENANVVKSGVWCPVCAE